MPADPQTAAALDAVIADQNKSKPWVPWLAASLPIAGQYAGETLGGIGGAMIPFANATGLPEAAGAIAGGGLGSAAGAYLENKVDKAYGQPADASPLKEGLMGAATSAIPFVAMPAIRGLRAAARVGMDPAIPAQAARQTLWRAPSGISYKVASPAKAAVTGGTHAAEEAFAKGLAQPTRGIPSASHLFKSSLLPSLGWHEGGLIGTVGGLGLDAAMEVKNRLLTNPKTIKALGGFAARHPSAVRGLVPAVPAAIHAGVKHVLPELTESSGDEETSANPFPGAVPDSGASW